MDHWMTVPDPYASLPTLRIPQPGRLGLPSNPASLPGLSLFLWDTVWFSPKLREFPKFKEWTLCKWYSCCLSHTTSPWPPEGISLCTLSLPSHLVLCIRLLMVHCGGEKGPWAELTWVKGAIKQGSHSGTSPSRHKWAYFSFQQFIMATLINLITNAPLRKLTTLILRALASLFIRRNKPCLSFVVRIRE